MALANPKTDRSPTKCSTGTASAAAARERRRLLRRFEANGCVRFSRTTNWMLAPALLLLSCAAGGPELVKQPAPSTPASGVELPDCKPNDPKALRAYYPASLAKNGVAGDVLLKVAIDKAGSITAASIVRDPGDGLGEAALQMVRKGLFSCTPGKQNGRPVDTTAPLKVTFQLND